MMFLRLLNSQGFAGLTVSLCLGILLVVEKVETRHWRRQSSQFQELYRREQSAFAATVADYRLAADAARASDKANAERVATEQRTINERTAHDYEARLAGARARAERLRIQSGGAADLGSRGRAAVPGLSTSTEGPPQASPEAGFPADDALIATEQAIQLDELIRWVNAQAALDPNGNTSSR